MNSQLKRSYLIWRIQAQIGRTYWWIVIVLVVGTAIGQTISQNFPGQKDFWHAVGIVGGLSGGVLVSFWMWRKTPEYKISRGDQYLFQNNYENAIEMYTQSIRSVPRHPMPFMRRGVAYQNIGKLAEALADYSKAVALKSNYAAAYANRAGIYLQTQDYSQAAEDLTIAIDLNIRTPNMFLARAGARYKLGQFDLALADLASASRLKPTSADAYYLYGRIYQAQNRSSEAIANYQKALELKPEIPKASEIRQYIEDAKVRLN